MLRDALVRKQAELGLADGDFAAMLKVPRSTWVLARTGRKPVRRRIALAALRAFPDLSQEALSILLADVPKRTKAVTIGTEGGMR